VDALYVFLVQEAERVLERIDQLHLEFAKRAAVCTSYLIIRTLVFNIIILFVCIYVCMSVCSLIAWEWV